MKQYAKLISKNNIEYPPQNKGNTLNYASNSDLLIRDGYLPLIEIEKPDDEQLYEKNYYKEDNCIYEKWNLVSSNYAQKRENEYPNLGDVVDAICKWIDGDKTNYEYIQSLRLNIKEKYPKDKNNAE